MPIAVLTQFGRLPNGQGNFLNMRLPVESIVLKGAFKNNRHFK